MNILARHFAVSTCALVLLTASAAVAGPKTYQVTGPVLALTATTVTIQKAQDDNWEIARDTSLKGGDALKVGDKVTVYYTMTATSVESKAAKPVAAAATAAPVATTAPAATAAPAKGKGAATKAAPSASPKA